MSEEVSQDHYESPNISLRGVMWAMVLLVGGLGAVLVISWPIYLYGFQKSAHKPEGENFDFRGGCPPTSIERSWSQMEQDAQQREIAEEGVMSIPVDEAIRLTAKYGLPEWKQETPETGWRATYLKLRKEPEREVEDAP